MAAPESFSFKSADATPVHATFVPPPQVREGNTYPLLVLLHGGPYTMWGDTWTYRWNPQVFAASGYGVLLVNRRGSTGYGQKFAAAIRNNWGNGPSLDIMAGIDATLTRYVYLDETRIAAAGLPMGDTWQIGWRLIPGGLKPSSAMLECSISIRSI